MAVIASSLQQDNLLVVEGFLDAGKPLPSVKITRAQPLTVAGTSEAVTDATLSLVINNTPVPYRPSTSTPGIYEPATSVFTAVPPQARFSAEVTWQSQRATTTDIVPHPIAIDNVLISVPETPVSAVLLDTLRLDNPEVGARQGFIYPIDVTISWHSESPATDTTYWIEARLKPQSAFSSTVLDVFLLTEDVQIEDSLRTTGTTRTWSGVYAIPVADSLAPAPAHLLTVQLTRGTKAYADFAPAEMHPNDVNPYPTSLAPLASSPASLWTQLYLR